MTWKLATLYTSLGAATALCARLAIAAPGRNISGRAKPARASGSSRAGDVALYSVFDNVAFQVVGNKAR